MKKISSNMHLKAEKKRIRNRREELEKKIRSQWNELKTSLRPVNIAKETFQKVVQNNTKENLEDESVFKSTIKYGISLLAKKLTDKAGEKFDRLFKKKGSRQHR